MFYNFSKNADQLQLRSRRLDGFLDNNAQNYPPLFSIFRAFPSTPGDDVGLVGQYLNNKTERQQRRTAGGRRPGPPGPGRLSASLTTTTTTNQSIIHSSIRGGFSNDRAVSSPVKTYQFLSIERAHSDDHLNAGSYASLLCAFAHFYNFVHPVDQNNKKRR